MNPVEGYGGYMRAHSIVSYSLIFFFPPGSVQLSSHHIPLLCVRTDGICRPSSHMGPSLPGKQQQMKLRLMRNVSLSAATPINIHGRLSQISSQYI